MEISDSQHVNTDIEMYDPKTASIDFTQSGQESKHTSSSQQKPKSDHDIHSSHGTEQSQKLTENSPPSRNSSQDFDQHEMLIKECNQQVNKQQDQAKFSKQCSQSHQQCEEDCIVSMKSNKPQNESKSKDRFDHNINDTVNHAHFLNFRNNLFEALEELRMRRVSELENEEKIKMLVKQRHFLEKKHKEELSEKQCEIEAQVSCVSSVRQGLESSIQKLQEEKSKLAVAAECSEKEARLLQEQLLDLQINAYTLEQKMKEQERKLQLQGSTKDAHLHKLGEMEDSCKTLTKTVGDLQDQHQMLQNEVKEAVLINQRLESVNEHQNCQLKDYKDELTKVKGELVKVKVKLDCQPQEAMAQQGQDDHDKQTLHQKIKHLEEMNEQLRRELEKANQRADKSHIGLTDSHSLIQRHLERIDVISTESEKNKSEAAAATVRLEQLKQDYDELAKRRTIDIQSHLVASQEWTKQESELVEKIKDNEKTIKKLTNDCSDLESLNSNWASENVTLTQQISDLKEKYIRTTVDVECQVCVTMATSHVQTEEGVDWQKQAYDLQSHLEAVNRERQLLESELRETKKRVDLVKKNKVSMATQTDNMKDDWVTSDTEGGLVMSQNAAATASLGQNPSSTCTQPSEADCGTNRVLVSAPSDRCQSPVSIVPNHSPGSTRGHLSGEKSEPTVSVAANHAPGSDRQPSPSIETGANQNLHIEGATVSINSSTIKPNTEVVNVTMGYKCSSTDKLEVLSSPPSKRPCFNFPPLSLPGNTLQGQRSPMKDLQISQNISTNGHQMAFKENTVDIPPRQPSDKGRSDLVAPSLKVRGDITHNRSQLAGSTNTTLVSCLSLPSRADSKAKLKKVRFSDELEHYKDGTMENEKDKENKISTTTTILAPVLAPEAYPKQAAKTAQPGEESLFSDDEEMPALDVNSQVARIESYLRGDRASVSKHS